MIVGIVQARLGSTRLPRKIAMTIKDKPLIRYLCERLECSKMMDGFVIACPAADAEEIRSLKGETGGVVMSWDGDENDVLGRFKRVLHLMNHEKRMPKAFVRICADSPLIDAALIDWMIYFYNGGNLTNTKPRTFPAGQCIEILNTSGFFKNGAKAGGDMLTDDDKEHVTPWYYRNRKFQNVSNPLGDMSAISMVVDELADFDRIKETIERMGRPHTTYGWREIAEIMA